MLKSRPAAMTIELLKICRNEPKTAHEIRDQLDWGEKTAARWLKEFAEMGLLVEQTRARAEQPGTRPREYVLSPNWGGSANGHRPYSDR